MRLIDADELLKKATDLEAVALEQVAKYGPLSDIHPGEWHRWDSILQERTAFKYDLMDAPIIDAVPVVRCKDCKYGEPNGQHGCKCYHYKLYETHEMSPNDFCSRAERREDETN